MIDQAENLGSDYVFLQEKCKVSTCLPHREIIKVHMFIIHHILFMFFKNKTKLILLQLFKYCLIGVIADESP